MTKYVACVKNKAKEGCDVILNPPKKTEAKKTTSAARWQKQPKPIVHYIWSFADEYLYRRDTTVFCLNVSSAELRLRPIQQNAMNIIDWLID